MWGTADITFAIIVDLTSRLGMTVLTSNHPRHLDASACAPPGALYAGPSALIGHHFWTMGGAACNANAISSYQNISVIGGFLLPITGAGRCSVDVRLGSRGAEG
jgi:hypothetical protein